MRRTKALESTAYHEAGHAVAAFRCRVRTQALSIVPQAGLEGYHAYRPYFGGINLEFDGSPRAQRRVENMALVCCAGPAAQRRFNPKGVRKYHGEDDRHQAIDLLSYLEGDNEVLNVYFKLINLQAKKFVALPAVWAQIEGLAEALLERQHLNGKEVRAVIHESHQRAFERHRAKFRKPPS